MAQICPGIAPAYAAGAIGIERSAVLRIASLLDRNFPFRSKQQAMASSAGGQNAIHHIHAQARVLNNFLGRAHSHQVARFVGGQVFERGFNDFARAFARLAYTESSNGVSREANLNRALGGFSPQSPIHAALDDTEERLCSAGALARVPPRNFLLVILKIFLAAFSPAQG